RPPPVLLSVVFRAGGDGCVRPRLSGRAAATAGASRVSPRRDRPILVRSTAARRSPRHRGPVSAPVAVPDDERRARLAAARDQLVGARAALRPLLRRDDRPRLRALPPGGG